MNLCTNPTRYEEYLLSRKDTKLPSFQRSRECRVLYVRCCLSEVSITLYEIPIAAYTNFLNSNVYGCQKLIWRCAIVKPATLCRGEIHQCVPAMPPHSNSPAEPAGSLLDACNNTAPPNPNPLFGKFPTPGNAMPTPSANDFASSSPVFLVLAKSDHLA